MTGKLDAAGCDIGVYYGPGSIGSVNAATITNAKYFGVVNYRGNVNVKNSTISQIGNKPFDGTQHGVGIFFTTEELPNGTTSGTATGVISSNVLSQYQKGGITVRGAGATAQIISNKLTGLGHVDFIAQNGIQVSFDANASVTRNTVTGHDYTPDGTESCGLLFYQAAGNPTGAGNTLSANELNICVVPPTGVRCIPTGFFRDGINLTAAKLGGNVTGKLDAAGCDIGVYYGPGSIGSVNAATITNAKYFGVVNYRGNVNVKNSTISQIGNKPFDGTQHGVGILFTTEELPDGTTSGTATGVICSNVLSQYQKGGITVRGAGATAQIIEQQADRPRARRLHRPERDPGLVRRQRVGHPQHGHRSRLHPGRHRVLRPALLPGAPATRPGRATRCPQRAEHLRRPPDRCSGAFRPVSSVTAST